MDPTITILRMAEIIARYEGTFQANTATIAQLQQDNLALKEENARLSEKPRKRAAANGARSESHESTRMP